MGVKDHDREPVHWSFCQRQSSIEELSGQEGRGMVRVCEYHSGGSPQATEVRLCQTAEVTLIGLGICEAGHP